MTLSSRPTLLPVFRQCDLWFVIGMAAAWLSGIASAQAQGATPPPPNVVTSGRSLILEWVIVGVMIALALFAVCRSSRRN